MKITTLNSRILAKSPMKRNLTKPIAALLLVLTLGVFTPAFSDESRPTLKFAGSTPAIEAIEAAFTMTLDNLIDINSITYDPDKWNDTGLLETAAESRFLRAAPSYGDNPWVHDGAYNTWSVEKACPREAQWLGLPPREDVASSVVAAQPSHKATAGRLRLGYREDYNLSATENYIRR